MFKVHSGKTELGVDALTAYINPTENTQRVPVGKQMVPEKVSIGHVGVTVQAQGGAFAIVLVEFGDQRVPVQKIMQWAFHKTKIAVRTATKRVV